MGEMIEIKGSQSYPTLQELIEQGKKSFEEHFNRKASAVGYSPGRVNLIGEHVDYNDGFVLPMAIPLYTVVVGSANELDVCRVHTLYEQADKPHQMELKYDQLKPEPPVWSNYVKGVMANFPGSKINFDAVIVTSNPVGGGLSSSAALELSLFKFLSALSDPAVSKSEMALLCQRADHHFVGVPCGIMDQMAVAVGQKDHAILLDCRSLKTELVPLSDQNLVVLVANSGIRHKLVSSEYAQRRRCCEQVASMMGKRSLRDVSMKELETSQSVFQMETYQYGRHVITEIERTLSAAEALKKNDYLVFGALMTQSHISLRDDYKVSIPEIDELCEVAVKCDGVYGSRITGGGFGGCTVTLVRADKVESTIEEMSTKCRCKPLFYVFKPCDGANLTKL
ncbi:N-acetylgalactosamine kinase [Brevipalpus obovatus]|uniref:N-acetylgalactosamine kinase n=1 Tax=Brevipalpus obovatus TaxID=246614 RepID=UPI003D9FAE16